MYHAPPYVWLFTLAEVTAFPLAVVLVLYGGARRAGFGRSRATLIAAGSTVVFAGWFTASGLIAGHGGYHTRLGHGVPWLPIVVATFIALLLGLSRLPSLARALAAPGMDADLVRPHAFRVAGVIFLLLMVQGHLPALFALPAGLGDIAAGLAAPRVVRAMAAGTGRRSALWFNAFGLADLVVALGLGAVVGYQLIDISPSGAPISELPLALVPSAAVPLLFALHIVSIAALRRTVATVSR